MIKNFSKKLEYTFTQQFTNIFFRMLLDVCFVTFNFSFLNVDYFFRINILLNANLKLLSVNRMLLNINPKLLDMEISC